MIPAELPPVDACPSPSCFPGDNPPCIPVGDPEQVDGGTAYPFQCDVCHLAWMAVFDRHGWIVGDRLTAPVVPAAA